MPTILTKINDPWASVDMVLPVEIFNDLSGIKIEHTKLESLRSK